MRQLSGLLVKNALDAEQASLAAARHARWGALAPDVRAQVKADLVAALSASMPLARQAAAQAIAKVGKVEVPAAQWPELIDGLVGTARAAAPPGTRAASLTALGYLCEEIVRCAGAMRARGSARRKGGGGAGGEGEGVVAVAQRGKK